MSEMRELPITLPSLEIAIIKVPVPMSSIDYENLMATLALWKDALVKEPMSEETP